MPRKPARRFSSSSRDDIDLHSVPYVLGEEYIKLKGRVKKDGIRGLFGRRKDGGATTHGSDVVDSDEGVYHKKL